MLADAEATDPFILRHATGFLCGVNLVQIPGAFCIPGTDCINLVAVMYHKCIIPKDLGACVTLGAEILLLNYGYCE